MAFQYGPSDASGRPWSPETLWAHENTTTRPPGLTRPWTPAPKLSDTEFSVPLLSSEGVRGCGDGIAQQRVDHLASSRPLFPPGLFLPHLHRRSFSFTNLKPQLQLRGIRHMSSGLASVALLSSLLAASLTGNAWQSLTSAFGNAAALSAAPPLPDSPTYFSHHEGDCVTRADLRVELQGQHQPAGLLQPSWGWVGLALSVGLVAGAWGAVRAAAWTSQPGASAVASVDFGPGARKRPLRGVRPRGAISSTGDELGTVDAFALDDLDTFR